jgi:splicing factor 3A subunit 3
MESLLEQQRRYHEEIERLMDAMVGERMTVSKTHRESLNSDHRQRGMIDRYMECGGLLKEIYEDKDGQRREEVAKLSGPNEFAEFYERLKQIKDFHRRHPGESISVPMSVEFEELKKAREGSDDAVMAEFSDEEGYGKYLDLHECYEKFVNLKGVEKVSVLNKFTAV